MRASLIRPLLLLPLVSMLWSPPSTAGSPDLCAERHATASGQVVSDAQGTSMSIFCSPALAPTRIDAEVCCVIDDAATCTLPSAGGRCSKGMKFWCEYGEIVGNAVTCLQPGPDACALGACGPADLDAPNTTIMEDTSWLCCNDAFDECVHVADGPGPFPPEEAEACFTGNIVVCTWGATNMDGTVDCFY
jgi:hypothetical protein